MKLTKFLNDNTYTRSFFLLAALFLAADFYLETEISNVKNDVQKEETLIKSIDAWKQKPKEKNHISFLKSLTEGHENPDIEGIFTSAGCKTEEVKEERQGKGEEGGTLFYVKGTGTFSQILTAFDIIEGKEKGMVTERCHIKKEQGKLFFEAAVRHMPSRGSYEKEKYSPDRSDGDRKEQSRQNPL